MYVLLISLVYVADVSKLIFINNETKRKIFINMLNQIIRKILVIKPTDRPDAQEVIVI